MRVDDRIIGFIEIPWIEWSNASGSVRLGIGEVGERRKGYGSEALNLLLHFAFEELNLFRLSALVPADNRPALGLFKKFGFIEEVVQRQALNRDGKFWDLLELGILSKEWEYSQPLMPGIPNIEGAWR